jgi:hypothetical protein
VGYTYTLSGANNIALVHHALFGSAGSVKDLGGLGPNAESQAFVTLVTKPNRPAPTGWVFRFLAMVEVWEKF